MNEVKLEIKNEVQSENTENSCQLQEVKKEKIKSESSDLIAFNTNQNNQPETNSNRVIKRVTVKNGIQIERVKSDASLEFEEVSPLSSPISSEFSISSIESFEDEVENIIVCVGNELAYQNNQDTVRGNGGTKFTSNVKQSESFKESRRCGDNKYDRRNSRSRTSNHIRDRSRDDNRSRYKYSLDRDRSRYSSSRYRRSRSWDRSRSRYTSKRSRRSRSWDRSRRQRDSRSPLFRTRRGRRRTRSHSRSRSRSRSRSYGSTKLAFDKRSPLMKKRRLSPVTPPKPIWKVLRDSVRNCVGVKPPSPKPPPLPASPPPSKPPPPAENIPLPEPSVPVNSVTNAGLFSHIWISHENHLPPNFYPFQNPAMPSISVNNLPLVPGLENLPVHVTMTGEQILHDMDGRPIPVGPNGRLMPLDMSGRLYPHIVFPYNNQAVPIYMSEDGVLRLPNGEPVPFGHPDKLPVNIDGSVIHIGPDSRPLYPCPNIPRQNPLITPQLENPAIPGVDETHQEVQPNPPPPPEIVQINSNANMKQRLKKNKLPPAVIQIKTVSDLKLKETEGSPEVETKTESRENLKIKSEEPAATETKSEDQKSELFQRKTPVENCKVSRRKKPYEDVDLPKLVKKFSERVSKINIREIYQKRVHGTIKDGLKPVEVENNVNVSKTDKKSGAGVVSDANPEKLSVRVAGEKEPRTCEKNSSVPRLGNEISAEEALLEKDFKETIQEAISLFAEIDFRPPVFGRFLFSKSKTTVKSQSSPNESPLLKNQIRLPFLTPENTVPMPEKKRSAVYFRFARPKDDDKDGKGTGVAGNPSFAVQCDFTSKKIRGMNAKIEKLRRELFRCKNQNAELTELYKSVREENKKKTDELAKVMKKVEEKNKIIRDLSQK